MQTLRDILGSRWTRCAGRIVGLAFTILCLTPHAHAQGTCPTGSIPLAAEDISGGGGTKQFICYQLSTGALSTFVNGTAGNIAIKYPSTDSVIYVSPIGLDSNDGLSPGSPKASLASALSALPTCTPLKPTNPSAPPASQTWTCGEIRLAKNTAGYTISSTLAITGMGVRIVGEGKLATVINCGTVVNCITWNNSASFYGVTFSTEAGLWNVTLASSGGTANQIGLTCTDCTGLNLEDVRFISFNGTGAEGVRFTNDANGYTERTWLRNVWFDDCTTGIHNTSTAGTGSMGHTMWSHIQWTLNNGQTAMLTDGSAQIYSADLTGVFNTNPPGTNTYTGMKFAGSGSIKAMIDIAVDNAGGGTFTLTSGATSSNFNAHGFNLNNSSNFNTQDQPAVIGVSAAQAGNSLVFGLGSPGTMVNKWGWYLDGSSNFSIFDFTNTVEDFLLSRGGFGKLEASCPSQFAGYDFLCFNSGSHVLQLSNNNGTYIPVGQLITTSFTTTAATTDNVTVTGMTATGHCYLTATNSGAAGGIASVFISAKTTNQITVTHTATSGWTFDVVCSPQ